MEQDERYSKLPSVCQPIVLIENQINTQLIPLSDPLVANMPLGRNIHSTKPFVPPSLGEDILAHMRAPPDVGEMGDDDSSSSDEDGKAQRDLPGAFPGSSMDQANENSYY